MTYIMPSNNAHVKLNVLWGLRKGERCAELEGCCEMELRYSERVYTLSPKRGREKWDW